MIEVLKGKIIKSLKEVQESKNKQGKEVNTTVQDLKWIRTIKKTQTEENLAMKKLEIKIESAKPISQNEYKR